MEFWINNGTDKFRLPINPPSFEVSDSQNNETIQVHTVGEVNLLGNPNLTTMTLSSFFPNQEYHFCQYTGFPKPYECVGKIRGWMRSKYKVQLVITGTDVNMTCTIESFTCGEEDATGDVKFEIALKKYQPIGYTKRVTTKKTNTNKKTYKVKKGDTLAKISKKVTGTSSNASAIYKKNKKVIEKAAKRHKRKTSKNGKYLYKGTKLTITWKVTKTTVTYKKVVS